MSQAEMERVANMRDIGGVPTRGGARVAAGRLYRSASPHGMTERDRASLRDLNVQTFIDLRTHWEVERQPYDLNGAKVVSIPLTSEEMVASVTERFMAGELTSAELENWWELVGIMTAPEDRPDAIRQVFEALADAGDGAVLFHCRGGKDRTGLVAALALEALGVDRSLVIEDFLRSTDTTHKGPPLEAEELRRAMEKMRLTRGALRSLSGVQSEWLITLLERLDAEYGSGEGYLIGHAGLAPETLERFRSSYLEPADR